MHIGMGDTGVSRDMDAGVMGCLVTRDADGKGDGYPRGQWQGYRTQEQGGSFVCIKGRGGLENEAISEAGRSSQTFLEKEEKGDPGSSRLQVLRLLLGHGHDSGRGVGDTFGIGSCRHRLHEMPFNCGHWKGGQFGAV